MAIGGLAFEIPVILPLTKKGTCKDEDIIEEEANIKYQYIRIKFSDEKNAKIFEKILKENKVEISIL